MLTEEDIKKLIEAHKEIFSTKEDLSKLLTLEEFDGFRREIKQDFSDLRETIQMLTVAVDKLGVKLDY